MATRKRQLRPRPRLARDVVEDARLALLAGSRMSEASAHAALVLFALGRALHTESDGALATLASAARKALEGLGEGTRANGKSIAMDGLTHRRFVVHTMSEILLHHRDALARNDPRLPPPLPASHMAQELSRLLGSGPLGDLYESRRSAAHDGDAERILSAWSRHVAVDGRVRVDEDPSALARKLVVSALVALGVPRKTALDGLARKATRGKRKVAAKRGR
jgi:hypothetical protein